MSSETIKLTAIALLLTLIVGIALFSPVVQIFFGD